MCNIKVGSKIFVPFISYCHSKDPNGELWCSTETDKRGRHKPGGGHWGYCHDGCDKKPSAGVRKVRYIKPKEYTIFNHFQVIYYFFNHNKIDF